MFLTSLSPDSTELSIRTQVLKSLPTVQPAELKSVVHVAKSRYAQGLLIPTYTLNMLLPLDAPLLISRRELLANVLREPGPTGSRLMESGWLSNGDGPRLQNPQLLSLRHLQLYRKDFIVRSYVFCMFYVNFVMYHYRSSINLVQCNEHYKADV